MSRSAAQESNPLLPGTARNESLQRAFDLLEAMAQVPDGATIAYLSNAVELPRTTVSRLLASLYDAGVVARPGSDRNWVLGPTIMRLTRAVAPAYDLQERGAAILERITADLEETSMLAIPTGPATARVIHEVRGPKLLGITSAWAGETIASPASGYVRQLLAELPEQRSSAIIDGFTLERHTAQTIVEKEPLKQQIRKIRADGFTIVVDELEEGLAGIGVPVRHNGQLAAMFAVYLPTVRFTQDLKERALNTLRSAAQELGDNTH